MSTVPDPKTIRLVLRLLKPWIKFYYRAHYTGLENLGSGPLLLIANHNAAAAMEPFLILEAWSEKRTSGTSLFALAHSIDFKVPAIGHIFRKMGAVPATYQEARQVIQNGGSLVIFPGGNWQAFRPLWEKNLCDFGGRMGWAKIAMEASIPVIPVAISGSHETNPMFYRSRILPYLLVIPKLLGINWYCISLAQILFTVAAFGIFHRHLSIIPLAALLYGAFLFTPLVPLFPSKIQVQFLESMRPERFEGPEALYREVTASISKKLAQ